MGRLAKRAMDKALALAGCRCSQGACLYQDGCAAALPSWTRGALLGYSLSSGRAVRSVGGREEGREGIVTQGIHRVRRLTRHQHARTEFSSSQMPKDEVKTSS